MIWVALLIRWGVNVLALIVVEWLFDGVTIGRWGPLLLGAAILTIGNTIIKPILAILTLPLIILTFGLAYFAINVLMLALAEWIAPDFSIDGFWTYVGATIVVWLVNVSVGWVLDGFGGDRLHDVVRVLAVPPPFRRGAVDRWCRGGASVCGACEGVR